MSDLSNHSDNEHQSAIKTPKQLIVAVAAGFIIPIIIIVLLVQYVTSDKKVGAGSAGQTAEAIAARLRPVADDGFTFKDASGPKQLMTGEAVYTAICSACHTSGAAGSPKFGDTGAWSARISQGYSTLVAHATSGIRAMPAKGGNPDLDDVEVARAVVYMANKAGASFKEPEVKAAGAAPAAEAAAAPVVAAAGSTTDAGKKLFEATCQACHGSGIAGAPKFGDKAAWADRLKQGIATLQTHAIKGFQGKAGMMPAKGGSSASDDEVKAAVEYMAAAAK
ncbi:MAG TPA: c-type cytochrome [Burkholderiaceae bacterium]|nr:c-type cytochrome [Burkholderiaceae bacterium]